MSRPHSFFRSLLGINVLFTKWSDPAFDISTGQFVQGTKASHTKPAWGPSSRYSVMSFS